MKHFVPVLGTVILFITPFIACKKVANVLAVPKTEKSIQEIKEWYDEKARIQISSVTSSTINNEIAFNPRIGDIAWDKTTNLENGKINITPFVTTTKTIKLQKFLVTEYDNNNVLNGYIYLMLIEKNKPAIFPEFRYDILNVTEIPGFYGAIIKYAVNGKLISSKYFENGKVIISKSDKIIDRVKVTGKGGEGNTNNFEQFCYIIDHWWVEWDTETYEVIAMEHLGETEVCTGGGGGGGNPSEPSVEELFQGIIASMIPVSVKQPSEFVNQTATQRTRDYPWIFYFTPGSIAVGSTNLTFVSKERGVQYLWLTGPPVERWRWSSLTHLTTHKIGFSTVVDVNITGEYGTESLNVGSSNDIAKMKLDYDVSVSFVFNAVTLNWSDYNSSSCSWGVEYGWVSQ